MIRARGVNDGLGKRACTSPTCSKLARVSGVLISVTLCAQQLLSQLLQ